MSEHLKKIFLTFAGILLVYIIVWMGTLIRNNIREFETIGKTDKMERTILVTADAKVTATPDIAVTTLGAVSEGKTVAEAQEKNTKIMNSLLEKLKGLGIAAEDLRTLNYNIYPRYNYTDDKGQELTGYEVNQSVQVKIRDVSKANEVFAVAGEVGANNVGGLQFIIDDKNVYLAEARQKAMDQVQEKARILSQTLGVRLGEVISYNEYESGDGSPMYYKYAEQGMGGGASPDIEAGSMEVNMTVNVTFEVL